MPLNIAIDEGARLAPKVVAREMVVREARKLKNPRAEKAGGITVPKLIVNQTKLQYERRKNKGRVEFRFKTGTLHLTLQQSVLISNTLSKCAQNVLTKHEQGHVDDNRALMKNMGEGVKSRRDLQGILIEPTWHPHGRFDAVQTRIRESAGDVFSGLTKEAVKKRDTDAEYQKIRALIQKCEGGK